VITINEIQDEIIDEFSFFDDWMGKYEHIIEQGKELAPLAKSYYVDENLVKGCVSQVWLHSSMEDGSVKFEADSDAIITKGLVAMVIRVLSGHPPEEIFNANLYFVDEVGLREHLSPNRSNGLVAMIKKMKTYAVGFSVKQEN